MLRTLVMASIAVPIVVYLLLPPRLHRVRARCSAAALSASQRTPPHE